MKIRAIVFATALTLGSLGFASHAAAQCAPDGDVQFVCGVPGPEDLLEVPETPWILVSSRLSDDDGHISVTHVREHTTTELFPSENASIVFDQATYGTCPGAPTATFQPHGIALREGAEGMHTVYVVGHGPRESVEVFTLDASSSEPTLTWIGCVVAPEGVSLNSVTPLPDGAIAVTNFNLLGGELWEWHPSSGWAEVPGTEMSGPNGLVASEDGRWFYIGGWGEEALVRVSRGVEPVERDAVDVGWNIDNVRWAPDGSILVGGQSGTGMASIGGCLNGGSCEGVASRAARIDPDALTVEPLVDYPSNERFPFATVAIEVGDELWLGGIAGGERIARFSLD